MSDIKKPVLIFTTCDVNNFPHAVKMINSLTKFHPAGKDIDILCVTTVPEKEALKSLPQDVLWEDLTPYLQADPVFFYRQKPILSEKYLDRYDLVIGMDADQIILGDLSYIWKTKDYDVGTVINWNRADPQVYGYVELNRIGILPAEYFNCGLVAIRNKKFAHHWKTICYSPQFDRVQYREQDILNVLCYYGNYNVRCFDIGDGVAKYNAWHGLIGKFEWQRSILRDGEVIVPKGFGDTPFPPEDMKIKIAHLGGGVGALKNNWGAYFPQEVMERINELTR